MSVVSAGPTFSDRVAEALYGEALALADQTHGYYDAAGREEREGLAPAQRVQFACEALKATTRLMHVIAWLAMRRAIARGEMAEGDPRSAERRLGDSAASDMAVLDRLPSSARQLILAGIDLYERVARIADGPDAPAAAASPARALMERLESAF
ncbi:DUF1465 family protein [uncultured Sphingomonas sp.]|uniref:DUF1465 family protein n=1 Tax=uncultured Sphingomonas sp. TaxID=158754 RepID=UPI0025FA3902|nr:DUF1465 family protein [uncultured Sphingomonas sp.]